MWSLKSRSSQSNNSNWNGKSVDNEESGPTSTEKIVNKRIFQHFLLKKVCSSLNIVSIMRSRTMEWRKGSAAQLTIHITHNEGDSSIPRVVFCHSDLDSISLLHHKVINSIFLSSKHSLISLKAAK